MWLLVLPADQGLGAGQQRTHIRIRHSSRRARCWRSVDENQPTNTAVTADTGSSRSPQATGSIYGGNTGANLTFTATMTALVAAGTYNYTVWTNQGPTSAGNVGSSVYAITVAATPAGDHPAGDARRRMRTSVPCLSGAERSEPRSHSALLVWEPLGRWSSAPLPL